MSRSRSQSLGRKVTTSLPPVVSIKSKERVVELKKVYGQPSTSGLDSIPSISAAKPHHSAQSRKTVTREASASSKQGVRPISVVGGPRVIGSRQYGRDEHSEHVDDIKDQLLKAKKTIALLRNDNKLLTTQINKLTRDAERREMHLQSMIANKFQPAELNDTQLAMTMTSLQKMNIEQEHLIGVQKEEIERLRLDMAYDVADSYQNGIDDGSARDGDDERERDSVHSVKWKNNGVPQEWLAKHKKKMEIARAHVNQNKQLKESLRATEEELLALKRKYEKGRTRIGSEDLSAVVERIQNKGILKGLTDGEQEELEENRKILNGELEHLHNERAHFKEAQKSLELQIHELSEQLENTERELMATRNEKDALQKELERLRLAQSPVASYKKKHYEGLFYGESIEDTDISPSQPSMRPDNIPPLDMRDVTVSNTPEAHSVNSLRYSEKERIRKLTLGNMTINLTDNIASHLIRRGAIAAFNR